MHYINSVHGIHLQTYYIGVLYVNIPLIELLLYNFDIQHDHFQKKTRHFDPMGSRVCVMTAYLLSWCSVLSSLLFDKQHDYFQKKIWFDLFYQIPGSRVCL